jgi:hypothetical protein
MLLGDGTQRASLIGPRPAPLLAKLAQQLACGTAIVLRRRHIGTISRGLP